MNYNDKAIKIIQNEGWLMKILRDVRDLNLTDCFVGSGAIRNTLFDVLHGFEKRTKLNDIDVVYFDSNLPKSYDNKYSKILNLKNPQYEFEVVNQAYIHSMYPYREPYKSTNDAISYWIEDVTCIGVRLEEDDSITVTDPNNNALRGIFEFEVSWNSKDINTHNLYKERMLSKKWKDIWPSLKINDL